MEKLGPTGEFPGGKLGPNDEGELKIAIAVKDGRIVIMFGKQIEWLGLRPGDARKIAEALNHHANRIEAELLPKLSN